MLEMKSNKGKAEINISGTAGECVTDWIVAKLYLIEKLLDNKVPIDTIKKIFELENEQTKTLLEQKGEKE